MPRIDDMHCMHTARSANARITCCNYFLSLTGKGFRPRSLEETQVGIMSQQEQMLQLSGIGHVLHEQIVQGVLFIVGAPGRPQPKSPGMT